MSFGSGFPLVYAMVVVVAHAMMVVAVVEGFGGRVSYPAPASKCRKTGTRSPGAVISLKDFYFVSFLSSAPALV